MAIGHIDYYHFLSNQTRNKGIMFRQPRSTCWYGAVCIPASFPLLAPSLRRYDVTTMSWSRLCFRSPVFLFSSHEATSYGYEKISLSTYFANSAPDFARKGGLVGHAVSERLSGP